MHVLSVGAAGKYNIALLVEAGEAKDVFLNSQIFFQNVRGNLLVSQGSSMDALLVKTREAECRGMYAPLRIEVRD